MTFTLGRCIRPLIGMSLVVLFSLAAAPIYAADPIKVGFSMALTGGVAPNGRQMLIALEIWRDDVNAKGGLLGRLVELVFYDDQSNPSNVPGIYQKLLSIDKVDLLIGPYATNMVAPAMPVIVSAKKTTVSLLALGVNQHFNYPQYFSMVPAGPDGIKTFSDGYFQIAAAQNPKPKTVAIVSADAEFARTAADGARANAKKLGFDVIYDKSYPPPTADFTSVMRAVQAANPDIVFVASYPPDTVGIVRATNELGYTPKMFGGAMIGLQLTPIKAQLGPLLNGLVINENYVPEPTMKFAGVDDFLKRYQERAKGAGVDPLGLWSPFAYAEMQILGQAVQAVGAIDQARLADYLHKTTFKTIVGDVKFSASGEWEKTRILTVQYRKVRGNDISQFREPGKAVIVHPSELKSGELVYPFAEARGH